MANPNYKLLFLGKADDEYCGRAVEFCKSRFERLTVCLGGWGDAFPRAASEWEGDFIFSYLSRWVVPETLLGRARTAAINFHPASPDYPGIGCNNFALYEGAHEYGVTCHHMAAKVDTGDIIAVRRFPVFNEDDVESLLLRTYENQIAQFIEIAGMIADGKELPGAAEKWTRTPFTRAQFDELFKITADMSRDEIARRVRAVSYEEYQPYIELHGYRFIYKPTVNKSSAEQEN
jgi:methionyl-tRNA formyltransferase